MSIIFLSILERIKPSFPSQLNSDRCPVCDSTNAEAEVVLLNSSEEKVKVYGVFFVLLCGAGCFAK